MGAVHLDQQGDITTGVLARKWRAGCLVALGQRRRGQTVLLPAGHQAGDMGAAVTAGVAQVLKHHTSLALATLAVVKAVEHAADVRVALCVITACKVCELNHRGCSQKFSQLLNRAQLRLVHVDHHPWMIKPAAGGQQTTPSGSFLVGNTRAVQAHTSLDKAVLFKSEKMLIYCEA